MEDLIETGGADVNGSYGPNEDTLLHIAVMEILDILLEAGANVNLPQPKTSATPLHCALLFGPKSYQGCVKKLLSAGADPLAEMCVPPEGVFGQPAFERFDAKMNSRWKEVMKLLGAIPLANMYVSYPEGVFFGRYFNLPMWG